MDMLTRVLGPATTNIAQLITMLCDELLKIIQRLDSLIALTRPYHQPVIYPRQTIDDVTGLEFTAPFHPRRIDIFCYTNDLTFQVAVERYQPYSPPIELIAPGYYTFANDGEQYKFLATALAGTASVGVVIWP